MVDPVIAIHRLRLALKCKNYPSHLKGTSSDGDVGQDPCKKFKSSSSFSSTSLPVPESPNDPESSGTIDHNLQFLLENDISQVEEVVTKYADELSETLGHMEHQLEKLLNSVMSQCRPMILKEKQQLQKMIQKLPSENLDRVAEIVQRNMPIDTQTSDEMYIDLDKESNMTLWRLYHYVEAVDKARELAL